MKNFKRIALLVVAAVCAVCIGVFAAACNTSNEPEEFTVTVYYSDGETVVNGSNDPMVIQICLEHERLSFCSTTTYSLDANGQTKINIANVNGEIDNITNENGEDPIPDSEREFVLHVIKAGEGQLDITKEATVSKSSPEVKIVLANVSAP